MLDLGTLKQAESIVVELRHPVTGAPLGATVTLAGPDHPARVKLRFDVQRRVRDEMEATGTVRPPDPEQAAAEAIDVLVGSTLGWTGIGEDGADVPFSAEAARALYTRQGFGWIVEQLIAALGDRARFFGNSATA